ncbi:MAG: cation:proton antiporter [Acidobacteriota bacterium]
MFDLPFDLVHVSSWWLAAAAGEGGGILQTVVAAVVLGIIAQAVAHRFKLPAILPLLILGMAAGPFGLGFFDPGTLGAGLEVVLHLGVAVILFEGGLSLDLGQLRQVGSSLRNLLTLGAAITGVGGAAAAHYLTGISWPTAALFGAIVTVTGPTVIAPLLRHMVAPKPVRTVLISEGLMIDAIGAVLAYMVLQWIERSGLAMQTILQEILTLGLYGTIFGGFAGFLAIQAMRKRFLPEELRNLVPLALLFGSFLLSERMAPQSGILSSVVMGMFVSFADIPDLSPLKAFKGQLTVLFISVLFVLLSGQLDLGVMRDLGWSGLAVVAVLILIVRPVSVFASVFDGALDFKQKLLLALTAPRGIVAAAVASLSAIQLRAHGQVEDAAILEGLIYMVILITCTWATVMAGWLPRWLGYYNDPSRRRLVLVGANELSMELGREFRSHGWTVVVVDSVARKLGVMDDSQILAVSGDARDAATYDRAGVERDCLVVSMTPNDELNLLVADLVRAEFDVEHPVVALRQVSAEFGNVRQAYLDLLGDGALDLQTWSWALHEGTAELRTIESPADETRRQLLRNLLQDEHDTIRLVFGWQGDKPIFDRGVDILSRSDRAVLLVRGDTRGEVDALLRAPAEREVPEDEPSVVEAVSDAAPS